MPDEIVNDRNAREALDQRDQRCALPVIIDEDEDDGEDTLIVATRTVDRYRARPGVVYVRRRIPLDHPVRYYEERRPSILRGSSRIRVVDSSPPPFVVQPGLVGEPVDDGRVRPLTADQVRRVLQQVFSEGEAALKPKHPGLRLSV